jgi:hypothetical protein
LFGEKYFVWTFFLVDAHVQEKSPPFSLVDELRQLKSFNERSLNASQQMTRQTVCLRGSKKLDFLWRKKLRDDERT